MIINLINFFFVNLYTILSIRTIVIRVFNTKGFRAIDAILKIIEFIQISTLN